MKTFVRYAVALLAIAAACQAGLALADDYYWTTGSDQTAAAPAADRKDRPGCRRSRPAIPASCCPTACGCEQSCGACDGCCCHLGCEGECERVGIVGFAGLGFVQGHRRRSLSEQLRRSYRREHRYADVGLGAVWARLANRPELRRLRLGRPQLDDQRRRPSHSSNSSSPPASSAKPSAISG